MTQQFDVNKYYYTDIKKIVKLNVKLYSNTMSEILQVKITYAKSKKVRLNRWIYEL